MKKRYITLITILLILISTFIFIFKKEKIEIIKGEFKYAATFDIEDNIDVFYYSDDYFKKSGTKVNNHLTTMSFCLALAISPSYETDEVTNINNLLSQIKFIDVEYFDILEDTEVDTIGTIISHKKIKDYDVVMVDMRGNRYGDEWASDVLVGENNEHKGFDDAKNKVINRLNDYIKTHDLKKIKLWIIGYSRAGAVANLMGIYLNENLDKYNLKKDDLYLYTFDAPNSSVSSKKYNNIHNVINDNDLVNYLPFINWSLNSNGIKQDITIAKKIQTKKLKISLLKGNIEVIDNEEMNLNDFLNDFFNFLNHNIDRKNYVNNLQKPLYDFLSRIFKLNSTERKELQRMISIYIEKLENDDELKNILTNYLINIFDNNDQKLLDKLTKVLKEVYISENIKISNSDYQIIENLITSIVKTFMPTIKEDLKNEKGMLYYLLTFGYNINEIIEEHFPYKLIELVKIQDNYYNK